MGKTRVWSRANWLHVDEKTAIKEKYSKELILESEIKIVDFL